MTVPLLIATAGHVDHGKSTLVQALTGTNPDRLAEEKNRGITIDLGYAHHRDENREYSFVDVPGHERFIHNMLAGVGSIDGVLFVIAADESVMPQTREHAIALRYLGIERVLVAITKIDLVDEDLLILLEDELDTWLEEMGWSNSPRVRFSAKRPDTTDDVRRALRSMEKREQATRSAFRLSIDRVFTRAGSGTVVTGTVDRGSVDVGTVVNISPSAEKSRIRAIQMHGAPVEQAVAHTRAALNLGDIHYKDLHRGDLIFGGMNPGEPGKRILARLTCFESEWNPSPRHQFHLHHLAAHRGARMIWRSGDFAVLELDHAIPFWALDRGLLRDGTPLRVQAGFSVIHPNLTRFRRRELAHLLHRPPNEDLLSWQHWFADVQRDMVEEETFLQTCGEPVLQEVREELIQLSDGRFMNRDRWERNYTDFIDALETSHQALPIYNAVPVNRVKAALAKKKIPGWLIDILFREAEDRNDVVMMGDRLKRSAFFPKWTPHRKDRLNHLITALDKDDLAILDARLIDRDPHVNMILDLLTWERFLVPLNADLWIRHDFLDQICSSLHKRFEGGSFSVGELKDMFGMTRKYAIPLLEYLDKQGCTRRIEEGRLWVASTPPVVNCTWRPP